MDENRFRNQCKNCHSFPGVDGDNDHNLITAKCCLKFKRLQGSKVKSWEVCRVDEKGILQNYKERINNRIEKLGDNDETDINKRWENTSFKYLVLKRV